MGYYDPPDQTEPASSNLTEAVYAATEEAMQDGHCPEWFGEGLQALVDKLDDHRRSEADQIDCEGSQIIALQDRIEELEAALKPFADEARGMNAPSPSEWYGAEGYPVPVRSHLWEAYVALYGKAPEAKLLGS